MSLADNYTVRGADLLFELVSASSKHDFFTDGLELCLHVYKRDTNVRVALGALVPKGVEAGKPLPDPRQYVPLVNGTSTVSFYRNVGEIHTNDSDEIKTQMKGILEKEIEGLREFKQNQSPTPLDGYFHFLVAHEVYRTADAPSQVHKNEIKPLH